MIIPKVKILVLIALWGITFQLKAQIHSSYTVIKVSGKVISKILNREIKSGDIVKPDDRLIFDTREAYVHVINSEGTKTIRNIPDNSPREFMQLMQTFLSPEKKSKASRGAATTNLENIKKELSFDTLLVLGVGAISIDTLETTLREPAGVSVSYMDQGKKVSKIISSNTGFNLGKSFLFSEATGSSYPEVTVMYHQDKKDPYFTPSVKLGSFIPYYVNEAELQQELKVMISTLNAAHLTADKIIDEIIHYLSMEYAAPIHENVNAWLVENKLMK